jgi:hypothetical protein
MDMEYQYDDSIDKADDDLRIVKLCYSYAVLNGLHHSGQGLTRSQRSEYRGLARLLQGDPQQQRRTHRRIATLLPATLYLDEEKHSGTVLNLSGSGMFVATTLDVAEGSLIRVVVSRPGKPKYIFLCSVRHLQTDGPRPGLGLSLSCQPYKEDSFS